MMPAPAPMVTVSVVVVSQGRPRLLKRCLSGIFQLHHPAFEVIVVTNQETRDAVQGPMFPVNWVAFSDQNISAARNRGIQAARGDIVAFIDDDAVPEPTWLHHLCAPFDDDGISASGGFVLGRNGISWQWRGMQAAPGRPDLPLEVPDGAFSCPMPRSGYVVKTQGTNCAFRRDVLVDLNGFDERLHFYLDETELNFRLARAGHRVAVCPQAIVHHGYAESARRTARRIPLSLFDIGASSAVVFSTWLAPEDRHIARASLREEQVARLASFRLNTPERDSLLASFDAGYNAGLQRKYAPAQIDTPAEPFPSVNTPKPPRGHRILAGRFWSGRRLRKQAAHWVEQGYVVSLYVFSPTSLWHKQTFTDQGYWVQTGGLFGRSNRSDPLFQLYGFTARVARETKRNSVAREWPEC